MYYSILFKVENIIENYRNCTNA